MLRLAHLLACLAFALDATLAAAAARSVFLEQLTSTELNEEIASGKTTILVPIGGTEQNGPHMVLGKHNVRAKALAERIALALGNAIVAPVVAYVPEGGIDPPTAHMRYPGTITVPPSVFVGLLESAAQSFRLHGFRDVVFLGDHGGYQRDEQAAAQRINRLWARGGARAHAIEAYYRITETSYAKALRERGYRDEEIGLHAGLGDTSLALAIDPTLVRTDVMQREKANAPGVRGDPRRASAELGAIGVEMIVRGTAEAIRSAIARDYRESTK